MSRAAGLFSDEVMGYGAEAPQLGGYSGSLADERVTDSLLPGGGVLPVGQKEEMLRLMSGGARRRQRGGVAPGAPVKVNPTQSRTQNPNTGMMLAAQGDLFENYGDVRPVTNVGPIQTQEFPRRVPQTPQKGLGSGLGNVGMLPGEEKKVPGAPSKLRQPQFGGRRKTRKHKKSKKNRTSQKQKSLINLRITGQIRLKQRHRQ